MNNIKKIIVRYRLLVMLLAIAPQLTGCSLLLQLLGLGLVDTSNNLPYRVVTNSGTQSEADQQNYYYGSFKPSQADRAPDDQGAGNQNGEGN